MGRTLWALATTLVALQALVYLALLIWPEPGTLAGAMSRFELWQATGAIVVQVFALLPILGALVWQLRPHRQARVMILAAMLATLALVGAGWIDMTLIMSALNAPGSRVRYLHEIGLMRWAEAALALATVLALRWGWLARGL